MPSESASSPSLEDYLAGKPLSEEIAALLHDDAAEEAAPGARRAYEAFRGAVQPEDLRWLKRMRGEPGWGIFRRLVEKLVDDRENACRIMSQQDPIGNATEIAKAWAYVVALKLAARAVLDAVEGIE